MNVSAYGLPVLGPDMGFYPVEGLGPKENPEQLWIPKGIQDYEALCLAQIVNLDGFQPTHIVSIARGGLATAQALLYANEIKPTLGYQTYGYDENDQPLDEPIIVVRPDFTGMRKGERKGPMRVLITDELRDAGKSIRLVRQHVEVELEPEEVKVAVIYDKDRDHVPGSELDYYVRKVRNVWLDHETQASTARRNKRLEQLAVAGYLNGIGLASSALAVTPADINRLDEMLEYTAQYYAAFAEV